MTDTAPNQTTEAQEAPAKGKSKGLVFGLAGLIAGGVVGTFAVGPMLAPATKTADVATAPDSHGAAAEGGHGAEGEAVEPHLLENLVVNPADSRGTRFLLFSVGIQMADAAGATNISSRDTEVRDRVLQVLGTKNVDELVDIRQRDAIRLQISASLDSILGAKSVRAVFFPQFVIQ